jgi:hypothetical protein
MAESLFVLPSSVLAEQDTSVLLYNYAKGYKLDYALLPSSENGSVEESLVLGRSSQTWALDQLDEILADLSDSVKCTLSSHQISLFTNSYTYVDFAIESKSQLILHLKELGNFIFRSYITVRSPTKRKGRFERIAFDLAMDSFMVLFYTME